MASSHQQDAPPSYETATGSSSEPTPGIQRVATDGPASRTSRNGIPPEHRRSMEDENRPLPEGWIRQFDPIEHHQFFVDLKANPPRSIWTHPYDDPQYLSTLSPEERKIHGRMHTTMSLDDVAAESSDDEQTHQSHPPRSQAAAAPNDPPPTGFSKLTRKMKDKLTSSTHDQRQNQRMQREEQERKAYQAHLQARQAMVRALETGQPQFLCKDRQGRDVYIEPPNGPGGAYGPGPRGYAQGAYGYNPYSQGPYADPNARFVRPVGPYGRPNGYGYGGGMGLGAPLAAGVLGGAVLGAALF